MRDRYTDRGRYDEQWDNKMRHFESTVGRRPTIDFRVPLTGSSAPSGGKASKGGTDATSGRKSGWMDALKAGAALAGGAALVAAMFLPPPPRQQSKDKSETPNP